MIPLALVTGFLGSGKTTLLQGIMAARPPRRLAYLVNEFSALDIDGRRLAAGTDDVTVLPGGSIFCQCLVTSFIQNLRQIAERHHQADMPLEGLIVEASGIADPRVVHRMLEETHLDRLYSLRRVVSVVDPASFLPLLNTLPNIAAQIAASDLALINKCDLHPAEHLAETEEAIRAIHPSIEIIRTTFCRADIDLLLPPCREIEPSGSYAPCVDPHYIQAEIEVTHSVDAEHLAAALRKLGADLYRVKGTIWTGHAWWTLDHSAAGTALQPSEAVGERCTRLAFVFAPQLRHAVEPLLRSLTSVAAVLPVYLSPPTRPDAPS